MSCRVTDWKIAFVSLQGVKIKTKGEKAIDISIAKWFPRPIIWNLFKDVKKLFENVKIL